MRSLFRRSPYSEVLGSNFLTLNELDLISTGRTTSVP